MLLATSVQEIAFNLVLTIFLLLFCVIKLLGSIDDDGEITKTAKKGLAGWIERWMK
jgi:hypothetical protein